MTSGALLHDLLYVVGLLSSAYLGSRYSHYIWVDMFKAIPDGSDEEIRDNLVSFMQANGYEVQIRDVSEDTNEDT